jgi:Na+/proline symporter
MLLFLCKKYILNSNSTKAKPKGLSGLFYSKNESWWLIGFSMILASGLIIEPQLICSALIKGQLSDMWLYWSGAIGAAFSISFFAHLWRNVPVKTENEFLFFRFSGVGAKILHAFRSLYIGGIIVPFIVAFSILAFSKIVTYILGISPNSSILALTVFLFILTFFNSFKTRLRMDFILFVIFIFLFLIIVYFLYSATGGFSHLSKAMQVGAKKIELLPKFGSKGFAAFLIFIGIQWWSASILDYPDMNGQKLMASANTADVVKTIFLPSLLLLVFRLLLFTLPFMAVLYGFSTGFADNELAFTALFVKVLPSWMLVLVIFFFMIPFLSLVQNNQNWGGALLIENFYKHHVNPNASQKKMKFLGTFSMLYIVLLGGLFAYYSNSLLGMIQLLFSITAGVGPVFVLRWYWWRINAWSQLSAMISAAVISPLFDWVFAYSKYVNGFILRLQNEWNLDYYPVKLLILTIIVCSIWLTVTFLTPPSDKEILNTFVSTVKPGGFWKGFENNGKSYFSIRVIAWIIQAANGFLVYFMFWSFLIGSYFRFSILLVAFICGFIISYIIISKTNSLYDKSLISN